MGQKVDPRAHRMGTFKKRPSERFVTNPQQGANFFVEDIKIRELVESFYFRVGISKVVIRKTEKEGEVLLFTAKPASIIGKDGETLAAFEKKLHKITGRTFKVTVKDIKVPELSAKIMAEFMAIQLE